MGKFSTGFYWRCAHSNSLPPLSVCLLFHGRWRSRYGEWLRTVHPVKLDWARTFHFGQHILYMLLKRICGLSYYQCHASCRLLQVLFKYTSLHCQGSSQPDNCNLEHFHGSKYPVIFTVCQAPPDGASNSFVRHIKTRVSLMLKLSKSNQDVHRFALGIG